MKRYRQTIDEILTKLTVVEAAWRDEHAEEVIALLGNMPVKPTYTRDDLIRLLQRDDGTYLRSRFDAGLTLIRLFLDLSKDELTAELRNRLGQGLGVKRALAEPDAFFGALEEMGILERMAEAVNRPVTWSDILVERLKGGRGSAIKGQRRGRGLEDFVEEMVISIFGEKSYHCRCKFRGAGGISEEKADFAIPSKEDPMILIEVKAYGATGSKQTDVLGDISRIGNEKRHDTHFLLITDGITWRERTSDLKRLVALQNEGKISRIYTMMMKDQLEADLRQLKAEYGL